MKEPTLLGWLQVAAGCLNYAMDCQRKGDQRDANVYVTKAEEALHGFWIMYKSPVKGSVPELFEHAGGADRSGEKRGDVK